MLDKPSENVLRYLIDRSNGNLTKMLILIPQDTAKLDMPFGQVLSICQSLEDKKLVNNFVIYIRNSGCRLYLTMDGYTYFDNKKSENVSFLKRSIIVPIIVTLLTELLLFLLKLLWSLIQ